MRPYLRTVVVTLALLGSGCSSPADPEPLAETPAEETIVVPEPTSEPTPEPAAPSLVVDLHVDTITAMMSGGVNWSSRTLEASLPALQDAGVSVVVQAAWVPRGVDNPRGVALGKVRRIRAMVEQSHGAAAVVTGPEQMKRVVGEGRIAVVLALEGGTALTDGEATLRELYDLGVRMVGLTWSESSPYADSSKEPRSGDAAGLTAAGREMVSLCNDLGIMLDVSHMSDKATADVLELSRAPVVASHSNARAVRDVPRNLPDDLLAGITARGGLVGALFHGPFVAGGETVDRADVVAMIDALVGRVGAAQVGIGTDFDGIIKAPEGLKSSRDLPLLRQDLLASGLSEEEVQQVFGGSFVRLWTAVQTARSGAQPL